MNLEGMTEKYSMMREQQVQAVRLEVTGSADCLIQARELVVCEEAMRIEGPIQLVYRTQGVTNVRCMT